MGMALIIMIPAVAAAASAPSSLTSMKAFCTTADTNKFLLTPSVIPVKYKVKDDLFVTDIFDTFYKVSINDLSNHRSLEKLCNVMGIFLNFFEKFLTDIIEYRTPSVSTPAYY